MMNFLSATFCCFELCFTIFVDNSLFLLWVSPFPRSASPNYYIKGDGANVFLGSYPDSDISFILKEKLVNTIMQFQKSLAMNNLILIINILFLLVTTIFLMILLYLKYRNRLHFFSEKRLEQRLVTNSGKFPAPYVITFHKNVLSDAKGSIS